MNTPVVSICLPVLNGREFLEPRLATILSQTLPDWELVVCDSHSDDGTWEYLQTFAGDSRVQLHQVPREGLYAGWNECLARVRGEYVYFATADDTMEPSLLAKLSGPLARDDACDLAYCWHDRIDSEGAVLPRPFPNPCHTFALGQADSCARLPGLPAFLVQAGLGGPIWVTMTACLFRRSLLAKTGCFRTDLGSLGDLEWALAAAVHTDFQVVPEYLATYRSHSGQATVQSSRTRRIWLALLCVRRALSRWGAHLPDRLRTRGGRRRVLAPLHHRLLAKLNRSSLKQAPLPFLGCFLRSLRTNPIGSARRLASAFSWDFPDASERAQELVEVSLGDFSGEKFLRDRGGEDS